MLKGQAASQIVRETITEVAEAIGTAEGVEVQVDWIDQKKRRILKSARSSKAR